MVKTRGMARRQNYDDDDASNRKRFKRSSDNGCVTSWSDLNHDVLFIVMMQLGSCIDFFAFSEVCKSWRSLALPNKKKFMASKPPMSVWIKDRTDKNECYLEDFHGRNFKTLFPHSVNKICVGLTCGYLILFEVKTRDFWLVNPITRHQLYFPCVPHFDVGVIQERGTRGILVFSPSISAWVFIVTYRLSEKIWVFIAGTGGAWNHVSSTFPILDLHAFKGKIYALNKNWGLCEMTLYPEPKLTLLDIKNCLKPCSSYPKFVSAGEKLYVIDHIPKYLYRVLELDFGNMIWVLPEEKAVVGDEYAFFLSIRMNGAAVKL